MTDDRAGSVGPELPSMAWFPPFVVGVAAAVAAETALGLLLYSGGGFLRALTLILATLLGALALGLWSAPGPGAPGAVERIRRRWLLLLVTYLLAALTAAAWSYFGGLTGGVLTRGLALALLAAAPLYATGALLGVMADLRTDAGVRGPGSAAAAGAALGAVCTGVLLVRAVAPFAMHVFILVGVSGGALLHGATLDHLVELASERGAGASGPEPTPADEQAPSGDVVEAAGTAEERPA